jgi:hypothetical protein
MAVEQWIDAIAKLWDAVSDGRGGNVTSYRAYERDNFPEALADFPCAITYVTEVENIYSTGGPLIDLWRGVTEFHLFPGVDKRDLPQLMRYFARIRNAASGSITLGGLVSHFLLRVSNSGGPSIVGPVVLQYGSEQPHHGLLVYWEVKETVSGDYTPAA